MAKIKLVIVDDHRLIRESVLMVLNSYPNFEVVGIASNGQEAIEIVQKLAPDIVLMDINMKPMDGFEATPLILMYAPATKVIGISMYGIPAYSRKFMKLGGSGYVTKNSSPEELAKAIICVHGGKKYICEEVKQNLRKDEEKEKDKPSINILSKREFEIVKHLKKALTSKEIAIQMGIKLKTVEVHRYNIMKKLNLKNVTALVNLLNESDL